MLAVNIGDAAVPHGIGVAHKLAHAVDIVRHDREAVVEYMVYRDDRDVGGDKLQHLRVVEIDRGNDDAVHAAVKAMLKICRLTAAYILIYKCDIVAVRLGLDLETVEHGGEVFMRKPAALLIDEEYADIIGSVCLERSGGGICHVPQLIRKAAYSLAGLLANIGLTVERLADRRDRHAAALGNFLHRNHERVLPFVFLNRLREYKISYFCSDCKSLFA